MNILEHVKHKAFTVCMLSSAVFLQACTSVKDVTELATQTLSKSGEHSVQLTAHSHVVVGLESGLRIQTKQNSPKTFNLFSEYLDVREQPQGTYQLLTVNKAHQLALVSLPDVKTVSSVKLSQPLSVPLEGLCMYQPAYEPLQVFLLGEDHIAYQMLVKEQANNLALELIRTLPLPPGAEYCAVDDVNHHLYVNEEDIGVWQYNARSESMIKRELVELLAPNGRLVENSGPIMVAGNSLLLSEKGGNRLHRYTLDDGVTFTQSYQFPQHISNDGMNAHEHNGTIHLAMLDETSGHLQKSSLPALRASNTKKAVVQLPVDAETKPVDKKGDAADDPAIWVNPNDPERSRILGTNKKQGLFVYDLDGGLLQSLLVDRVNNVDVRSGFTYQGQPMDIAAASQRDRHAIALFKIDPASGNVTVAEEIETTLDDVYGMCMSKGENQEIFVFINDEDGRYEQWQILDTQQGWQGKKVRTFAVASQPEGCTVDERAQRLFVGEEAKGVWTLGAMPNTGTDMHLIAQVDTDLVADVEGMEIYQTDDINWLVVSSQGDDSYVVYQAEAPYTKVGKFRLGMNAALGIDGASETDGLTVTSANLGGRYPNGIMVAQDGRNHMPEENQNFKLIDWRKVQSALISTP